jgi:acyl-CoA thioester hydrolase
MSLSVFRWRHRVTYAECTVGNHVYYARYLDILEEARGEFFRHAGQPLTHLQETNIHFPVIEARLWYRGAARYDDVLTIEVAVAELAKVRLVFNHRILHESGRLLAEGATVHACTSLEEKPKRIPSELATALAPFVVTAAEGHRGRVGKAPLVS